MKVFNPKMGMDALQVRACACLRVRHMKLKDQGDSMEEVPTEEIFLICLLILYGVHFLSYLLEPRDD